MHVLDNHINDISARIEAIYENGPRQEEPSLQEALASYGWILLDSWVAWRTMRFLIKDMDIDEAVLKKWFQTPGSYTASQLKGVWKFNDATDDYVFRNLDIHMKSLFDDKIQKKRNSAAHFNGNSVIRGMDTVDIRSIYSVLSNVFLFYEVKTFISVICEEFSKMRYEDISFTYPEEACLTIEKFPDTIENFSKYKKFTIVCTDTKGKKHGIFFSKDGCKTGKQMENGEWGQIIEVGNDKQQHYQFFKNKGYYQNSELFLETVLNNWQLETCI